MRQSYSEVFVSEPGIYKKQVVLTKVKRFRVSRTRRCLLSLHRTGKLAAVEEVECRSDHRAQQHVYVESSPLRYRFPNVVLIKEEKKEALMTPMYAIVHA